MADLMRTRIALLMVLTVAVLGALAVPGAVVCDATGSGGPWVSVAGRIPHLAESEGLWYNKTRCVNAVDTGCVAD